MGCPALELAGQWVELGLSIGTELSGRALADWYYVGLGGLWWSIVQNLALPPQRLRPDTRPDHQDPVSHMTAISSTDRGGLQGHPGPGQPLGQGLCQTTRTEPGEWKILPVFTVLKGGPNFESGVASGSGINTCALCGTLLLFKNSYLGGFVFNSFWGIVVSQDFYEWFHYEYFPLFKSKAQKAYKNIFSIPQFLIDM